MAYITHPEVHEHITLAEFVDLVDDYDLSSPELVLQVAPLFASLNANQRLMQKHIRDVLENPKAPALQTEYSGQTFLLADNVRYLIRANIWLPNNFDGLRDFATSGQFFYDVPHDHNFTFLTACHIGPGYRTQIFEYDDENQSVTTGDEVETRFLGEHTLSTETLMVYRASRDIHIQYPPEKFSVSINLMTKNAHEQLRQQNLFDSQLRRVVDQPRGVKVAEHQLAEVVDIISSS